MTLDETKITVKIQNELSKPTELKHGVRQGDVLTCLHFNLALKKILRDRNINTKGNIFNKLAQLTGFC
ncbi:hypothetical protein X975_04276, partial [Stegodyphus mimosarum]